MIPQNSHASSGPRFRGEAIAVLLRRWRGTPGVRAAKDGARSVCPKRVLSRAALVLGISPCRVCSFQPLHRGWLHVMRESSQTASIRGKLVIGHSIQLGVFRLGFSEDWDVTIGIFPDGEKLLSLISRPEAGKEVHGSQERVAFEVFLIEIDEQLKRCVNGPDQERDRMIFWLYFRQGMSTKEIASLPTIGLGAKGVGS